MKLVKYSRYYLKDIDFCNHKFLQLLFLQILPKIAKNYVAKRIDFLRSRKNYHHNNFKFQKCTKSQKTDLAKLQFYRKKSY